MIGFNWTASLTEIIRQIKFIFLAILIILIVLSIIDFIYQKWEYEQDIKMKKEEVKQEHKDNEGAASKRETKNFMHAILQGTIAKKMDGATFIVNNPTHISVVLRYNKHVDAPIVVAKGKMSSRYIYERLPVNKKYQWWKTVRLLVLYIIKSRKMRRFQKIYT